MVRTALDLDRPDMAQRLLAGVEPHHLYTQHALAAAHAAITEDLGDHRTAADAYTQATTGWEHFGVVPEHAYALLGHSRSLLAIGRPTDAEVLQHARNLFDKLRATPTLTEIDTHLQRANAPHH